jgi:hypothetical protein
MVIKAALKTVLSAGETIVAESDDPVVWHRALAAMTESAATPPLSGLAPPRDLAAMPAIPSAGASPPAGQNHRDAAVERLASELGVGEDAIASACAPSREPPYLHLDRAAWQVMQGATPPRGPGSVAPAALAAALLVLWFRCAELGNPTMKMLHLVLRAIGIRDKNAARVVDEAKWLHARGGQLALRTPYAPYAVALANAFCARDWTRYRAAR